MTKYTQNPGLVNKFSATPRGQLNWTGPIANGSDLKITLENQNNSLAKKTQRSTRGKSPKKVGKVASVSLGRTPRGSCNRTLLRRVLRRFSNSKYFLEGFLEGALQGLQSRERFLEGFLEGGGVIEGAWKALRRQKHALSQSTTPFACTLIPMAFWPLGVFFLAMLSKREVTCKLFLFSALLQTSQGQTGA